ncbi:uncharacterized protein OGAPODRAFT_95894 [Ogataea polymorpha]|uniref:uncharacterized protein n=1 Tax=Ogataea polymorpha TaxID=460523 RepID=UPI0007F52086|nr:uncharacterized protein OGAPODRAFT_95894 [Ogataea polymorpha]OBA13743.1 hypothetical protein OGAPODRAFT_95894 [Ogataea polymorpha]
MLFPLLLLVGSALAGRIRPFPDPEDDISKLPVYARNDAVPLQCNARQIDNGEHKFDSQGNVVYADFLKCQETAKPLALKYGLDEQIECTVKFEDEIYHLFQLYLHNDAPFSCKVDVKPKSGVGVPIVFQFRGVVEESHFDLDPNVNVLFMTKDNQIVSGTAWSSSLNTTKVIIGDSVPLKFDVKWLGNGNKDTDASGMTFVRFPKHHSPLIIATYCAGSLVVGAVVAIGLGYKRISKKIQLSDLNKVD